MKHNIIKGKNGFYQATFRGLFITFILTQKDKSSVICIVGDGVVNYNYSFPISPSYTEDEILEFLNEEITISYTYFHSFNK